MATLAELEQQRASFVYSRIVAALVRKKIKFSRNFRESFVLSPGFLSPKRKINFVKTLAKKMKLKTFIPTLMKFVAKPHHFHAAPTSSQYFEKYKYTKFAVE
jgi:hypothetical protein